MKKRKVIVIGGGVAGLSAAHELAERDFQVTVYERNRILGGKSRGVAVSQTATAGREALPGEHGFRFFPGWYRHLPDTMSRIPYPKTGKTVSDNLVPAEQNLLASYDRDPIRAVVSFPKTWEQLKLVFKVPHEVADLVPAADVEFFLRKMASFVVSCEERRRQEVEPMSWWQFMEADSRSREFQLYLVKGGTQNSVAAKPEVASAYTISKLVVQTFVDMVVPGRTVDRVLNGPTQEVWIEPWRRYLEQQGVVFKFGLEFDEFEWSEREEIAAARFRPTRDELKVAAAKWTTVRFLLDVASLRKDPSLLDLQRLSARASHASDIQFSPSATRSVEALAAALQSLCLQQGVASEQSLEDLRRSALNTNEHVLQAFRALEQPPQPSPSLDAWLKEIKECPPERTLVTVTEFARETSFAAPLWLFDKLHHGRPDLSAEALLQAVSVGLDQQGLGYEQETADFFVLALPVEQAAYYINRSAMLTKQDARLVDVVRLSEHVDWMAGVQFFLRERLDVTRGHIDCLDSEWALTGIFPVQFWEDVDMKERGDGSCKSIFSVVISDWSKSGVLHKKPAWDCTAQEIAEEVWDQLRRSLNRTGQSEILHQGQLVGGALVQNRSFFIDDSIIERFDRKKQGLFEKFRRVAFDGGALTERQLETQRSADAPEAFGPRAAVNAEPLLINRAGALALRPSAKTRVRNLFLAADYVGTLTNLACMEGANEAARLAVNAILAAAAANHEPCEIWPPSEPLESMRLLDKQLLDRGQRVDVLAEWPLRMVGVGGKVASGAAEKVWRFFKDRL